MSSRNEFVAKLLKTWAAERDNERDGARDLDELRRYLADDFDEARLQHTEEQVNAEAADAPDELTFYRTSQAYLYDLTTFAAYRTKVPYRTAIRRLVPPGSRLLDFGCGIGCDGLRLWDDGYRVDFTDFDNPSLQYLRWRLADRGIEDAAVLNVESDIEGRYDLAYSFDVIEHVDDPFGFLARMESLATLVAVNLLEPHPLDIDVHHDLPLDTLMEHAERCGLLHYRVHYGRSHFVIYQSPHAAGPTSTPHRLASATKRRLGRQLGTVYRVRAGIQRRMGAALGGA